MSDPVAATAEEQRCSWGYFAWSLIAPAGVVYFFYLPGNDILPDFKELIWSRPVHVLLLSALFVVSFAWGAWAYGLLPRRISAAQASITRCRLAMFYLVMSTWAAFVSWLVVAGIAVVTLKPPGFAILGHTLWIMGLLVIVTVGTVHTVFGRSSRN